MIKWFDSITDKAADFIVDTICPEVIKAKNGAIGLYNLSYEDNYVTQDQYRERLKKCNAPCPHNKNETCQLCGCPVERKALLKESKKGVCPDNRWKKLNN